jgi:hypothetical protein
MPPLVKANLLPSDDAAIRTDGDTNAPDQVAFMRQWFREESEVSIVGKR